MIVFHTKSRQASWLVKKTPAGDEFQKLEQAGFLLNVASHCWTPRKLGLGVSVFVQVKTNQHA